MLVRVPTDGNKEQTHLLEPMLTMALAGGPMNTMPSWASFLEKVAFSLRNP